MLCFFLCFICLLSSFRHVTLRQSPSRWRMSRFAVCDNLLKILSINRVLFGGYFRSSRHSFSYISSRGRHHCKALGICCRAYEWGTYGTESGIYDMGLCLRKNRKQFPYKHKCFLSFLTFFSQALLLFFSTFFLFCSKRNPLEMHSSENC